MQKLQPYLPLEEEIQIEGDLQISDEEGSQKISLKFSWTDPAKQMVISDRLKLERQNELWKTTCFEAFLQPEGEEHYFEINLSSHGAWSSYAFEGYRLPQPPAPTEKISLLAFHRQGQSLEAHFSLKLPQQKWRCSLTAVIELKDGKKYYFATDHTGPRPDFHLKESFKLRRVPS